MHNIVHNYLIFTNHLFNLLGVPTSFVAYCNVDFARLIPKNNFSEYVSALHAETDEGFEEE